jgi:hypothetical protein
MRRTRSRSLILSALLAQLAGCGGNGGQTTTTGTGTGTITSSSSTGGQPNVGTVDVLP